MKVDWKTVSQSKGYKSLKKDFVSALQYKFTTARDKAEYYKEFRRIIGRAQHYAHHRGTTVDVILDEWESKRTHNWRSFYGSLTNKEFTKLNLSYNTAPRSYRSYNKIHYRTNAVMRKAANFRAIKSIQARNSLRKGKKARTKRNK